MKLNTLFSRKRLIITSSVLLVFVVLVSSLNSCMQMRTSNKAVVKRFDKAGIPNEILTFKPQNYDFSTRIIKTSFETKKKAIVFIHGAPGSSDAFYEYLEDSSLLAKANLYSVDRVGYGYSNFGKSLNSIEAQAKIISEFIDREVTEDSVIVIGHSFGGPIAGFISSINNKISNLYMLAPANDPTNEKIFWFSHFGRWKATKWFLPKPLQVAGDEKFSHADELEKIKNIWPLITVPTTHFHGKADKVVPFINLTFTKALMQDAYFSEVIFEKENHFIPWTQKELIVSELMKIL